VFQPLPSENSPVEEEEALIHYLEIPYQLDPPLYRLFDQKLMSLSKSQSKKLPGYDLIKGKIVQVLPVVGIQYLTQIFNAIMLTGHFSAQSKVAQIR
jgi:hypothetical protein